MVVLQINRQVKKEVMQGPLKYLPDFLNCRDCPENVNTLSVPSLH